MIDCISTPHYHYTPADQEAAGARMKLMSENTKKHFWLYVLLLEQDKFYVGITARSPEIRFNDHKKGFMAAKWTKKYSPIKIIDRKDLGKMTELEAKTYENQVVRKYMEEKGHNNVRGGDLTDESDYAKRLGYYFRLDDWETLSLVVLLLLVIAAITILYYLK
jgi:predicted GIY-YIG superfamily endonuclease